MLNKVKKILSGIAIVCSFMFISYGSLGVTKTSKPELTMWTWKVAYLPGFRAVAQEYYKKTGIKINVEAFTPDDSYRQKVFAATNGNSLPDIVHIWAGPQGIENGLVELSSKIDNNFKSKFLTNAFYQVTINQAQKDIWNSGTDVTPAYKNLKVGEMYGLPLDVGNFFMIYANKKILKEAGLENKAPETWEEFVEMMKTIKAKTKVAPFVYPAIPSDIWQTWAGIGLDLMYNGVESYQRLLDRTTNLSDDNHRKIIQAVVDLAQQNLLLPGVLTRDIDGNDQAFAIGKSAFCLGGTFTLSNLIAMGMKQQDIMSFSIPALKGSKHKKWKASPFTLTMVSLSKTSKYPKEALDFIKYLTSDKDAAITFSNNSYTLPAANLGDRAKELNSTLYSMIKTFVDKGALLAQLKGYPDSYYGFNEWRVFETSLQKVIAKKSTTDDVIKEFNESRAREKKAQAEAVRKAQEK